ncbi:hypothetical protein CSOJ01_03752 [Colletotrichum sojae]|uniref:Uncharacterized protein n=1 Tax=Colletotrichum sojae TaxID=2175907 RepID=A0A8H6MZN3_9PEZI|nr:hypothetical protein CSOJ01_03752 [Colletotrichum sojae]
MRPDKSSPPSRWRRAKQIARSVLSFSRSAVAEYVVYFLLGYSTTAVVTLVVFTPVDGLRSLWRGEFSRGHLVAFRYSGFLLPFNFSFINFSLPTRILLVSLWAITARPALALAGFIVQKRLPAYTHTLLNSILRYDGYSKSSALLPTDTTSSYQISSFMRARFCAC